MVAVLTKLSTWILAPTLALLTAVVAAPASEAKTGAAVPFLDLTRVDPSIDVSRYLSVLEDCSGRLDVGEVHSLAQSGRFRPLGALRASYGYSTCAYWLRLALRDRSQGLGGWILMLDNPRVDAVDLYEPHAGTFRVQRSGSRLRIAERSVRSRYPALALRTVESTPRTFYLRVQTTDVATFPLQIVRREAFWRFNHRAQIMLGGYFGLIAFAALLNAFVLAHLKDITYLIYVLLVVCYGLFQAAVHGVGVEYLWPDHPHWGMLAVPVFCGLSVALVAVFSWRFLGLAARAPELRVLAQLTVVAGVLIAATALLGEISLAGLLGSVLAPLALAVMGVMGTVALFRGCPYAKYLLVGASFQLLGVTLNSLRNFAVLPTSFLTSSSDQIGSCLFVLVLSVALTARFDAIQRERAEAQRVVAEFSRKTAEAKLQALQAKINPHFLFNTLNTIAGLIREAPGRAEEVVLKLARLFRYALTASEHRLVPLTEELSIVRSYLEIERARFGERLDFVIRTEGPVESVTVPGLTLQPIVENSIKHGLRTKTQGGRVVVTAQVDSNRCQLTVEDNGTGIQNGDSPKGHGLASVRERLLLAYGDKAHMSLENDTGLRVSLVIPRGGDE